MARGKGGVRAAPVVKRIATGKGYYVYRDARGKFASKEAWEVSRARAKKAARYSAKREAVLKDMKPRVRRAVVLPKQERRRMTRAEVHGVADEWGADSVVDEEFELTIQYQETGGK